MGVGTELTVPVEVDAAVKLKEGVGVEVELEDGLKVEEDVLVEVEVEVVVAVEEEVGLEDAVEVAEGVESRTVYSAVVETLRGGKHCWNAVKVTVTPLPQEAGGLTGELSLQVTGPQLSDAEAPP